MSLSKKIRFTIFNILILLIVLIHPKNTKAQVVLRDTLITWQHHAFELNTDYSMKSHTSVDSDIRQVQFNGKVIENDLIRLVVVPEYGARVLSFVYKPTGHENLYQSPCGSAYGIREGNFYYNWLMVWGGIFPTFPEPEHGKTWLLAWDYSVVKNNTDTVTIRMEYTDTTAFSGAPGKFNNGISNITCQVEVSVYKGVSAWDFEVKLLNNKSQSVNYEYWTCTTLTPGSEIGNTGSPLNSEMVVPIQKYKADWSPGSWIGNYGSLYSFSRIDYLSKWTDMGIAYADNLSNNYWGVINHENEEGIFRISENIETSGMKFWTWGKNNLDNNMFDYSNGGADNYIELWAGVSHKFFSDAVFPANETKVLKETYVPTVAMNSAMAMTNQGAVNLKWNPQTLELAYELNIFNTIGEYAIAFYLEANEKIDLINQALEVNLLGNSEVFDLHSINLNAGDYKVNFDLLDKDQQLVLHAEKEISIWPTDISNELEQSLSIATLSNQVIRIGFLNNSNYQIAIYNAAGQLIKNENTFSNSYEVFLPKRGLYIFRITDSKNYWTRKIIVN